MRGPLHRFGVFLAELARAQHRDQLMLHAGALAYTTLLSLVPIFTVLLVSAAGARPESVDLLLRAITAVLPFSPELVQSSLTEFAQRTAKLGWIAVSVSFLVAFNMLYQVEEVINMVWGLPYRRKLRWRLAGIGAVLIWGPLLLIVLFSGLYWLSAQAWYPRIVWIGRPLPAVFAFAALAVLHRLVPNTKVTWKAAFIGAAVATIALLAIHIGFQAYLTVATDVNVIYGSLSFALFFLLSLYLFWFAILLGVEASWVVGHAQPRLAAAQAPPVLALLLEAEREGAVSEDRAAALVGPEARTLLQALAAPPEILVAGPQGWALARPAFEITVGEVLRRIAPCGEADSGGFATLASLVKEDDRGHGEGDAPRDAAH